MVTPPASHARTQRELQGDWAWLFYSGAVIGVLGIIALLHAVLAQEVIPAFFGWTLMIAAPVWAVYVTYDHRSGRFALHVLLALAMVFVGGFMLRFHLGGPHDDPLLVMVYFFVVAGIRCATAWTLRKVGGWFPVLLDAACALALAIWIQRDGAHWRIWVLGMCIGIHLCALAISSMWQARTFRAYSEAAN